MTSKSGLADIVHQMVRDTDISTLLGRPISFPEFHGIGDVHSTHSKRLISYIKDEKFIEALNKNRCIEGVFCKKNHAPLISERVFKIECDDPNFAFFSLLDFRAKSVFKNYSSLINSEYDVSRNSISENGVFIGKRCVIESNVVIHPGVEIGDDVIIRSGAVLGLDTFQHQRHVGGILSPKHDGILIVEDGVEIGSNVCISKGFSYRPTVVGKNTKIDALSYVGHGAQIGQSSIICAGARLMGHVMLSENVFVGPSATVTSRIRVGKDSKISIGSVVTKDVPANTRVTGNFAVDHENWIEFVKSVRSK